MERTTDNAVQIDGTKLLVRTLTRVMPIRT